MKQLEQLKMYWRFAAGLPAFLRNTISVDEAKVIVKQGMQEREDNFLALVRRGILSKPDSPYAKLLRLAQCDYGDLEREVRKKGLSSALRSLRQAGVYITFEELKGREPIVRHGESFPVTIEDFSNPLHKRGYQTESGGSTGRGIRCAQDLDHLARGAAYQCLLFHAHGALHAPVAVWRGVLPDGSGINNVLRASHFGQVPEKWFSPTPPDMLRVPTRFRLATYGTVIIGRAMGIPIPWPEMVPIDQAIVVARWAAETVKREGACVISAAVSRGLRVAVAAREAGLDLTGTKFMIAGEPPTPAKVAGIHASGADHFTTYGLAEFGRIAMGCANPITPNDLHIMHDGYEVFTVPQTVPGTDVQVDALNITTLLPTAPQIFINAEMDDYGVLEERDCGCPLGDLGYHLHIREIHSYRKLTGEGVSLVGSELIDVIERILPERFGGSALDYQLMEEEEENGFTRLSLLVSPKVQIKDESQIVPAVLEQLHASSLMADVARGIWSQTGTLQLKRRDPVWTGRGKLMPLYLANRQRTATSADQSLDQDSVPRV